MGRSFKSVRMGAKAASAIENEDRTYASSLAEMAKKHSREAFYGDRMQRFRAKGQPIPYRE